MLDSVFGNRLKGREANIRIGILALNAYEFVECVLLNMSVKKRPKIKINIRGINDLVK